jgi:diacylglycerol O-acyltransferase
VATNTAADVTLAESDGELTRSEALGALDTIMWRSEVDPSLRSTMAAVEILDCTPDWDRFLAAHEWATRMLPRFRKKVVESAIPWAMPRWTVDEDFDLHYHVRRSQLPAPATWATLLEACEQIVMTPFDRARPPWEVVLFEGLPDGRAAYLLKLHHATADGLGAVALMAQVHSKQREPNPDRPDRPAPGPPQADRWGNLGHQLGEDLAHLPGTLRSFAGAAASSASDPLGTARSMLRYGSSLRRMVADPMADGSPLLAKRSLSWRFGAMDLRFQDLRAAAKSVDSSINNAYVAALLGGLRRYHETLDCPVDRIPMAIPVSVRRPGDPEGTNRITSARIAGPVGIVDPAERIHEVGRLLGMAREEPANEATSVVAPYLARLPGPVLARFGAGLTKANDLQASNIPGIRHDVFLAGARIERTYPFGPLPGCAMMITMLSHGETICVGANYDAASVTEPELFMASLAEGFEEVLGLIDGAEAPVVLG